MNNKSVITILIFLVFVLGGFVMYENYAFPIKYKICDITYSECFIVAKFDDLDSCERIKEKDGWYCDTVTDPLKPDCRVGKSNISTAFCSE